MFHTFRQIRALLGPKDRRKAVLLLIMIILMAFLDALGVASIMPFMAVLSKPELIKENAVLKAVFDYLGFTEQKDFMFFLGVTVFSMLILSISFKAFTTWLMLRYSRLLEYSLAKRFVELYLRQKYEWYIHRHSSDLGKTVLDEVGRVVGGAIMPILDLIAQACVVIAMIALLVITNPVLASVGGLGMGSLYILIYASIRHRLAGYGEQRRIANKDRFHVLGEVFGGIKDIKVASLEERCVGRFDTPAYRFAIAQGSAQAASQLPRYAMEMVAFGGILAVVLYLMRTTGSLQNSLPVLSLYALAGYRLMPSMQNLFVNFAALRIGTTTLNHVHEELLALEQTPLPPTYSPAVPLEQYVRLDDVTYSYPGSLRPTLQGLSLAIEARSTIGLVGTTGSGKTTTVDVILGLLQPEAGRLVVDGTEIDDVNRRGWQAGIGYVSQHVFLTDDTVSANIAFGVPREQIDYEAVERAARAANLHDFVVNSLPDGYNTSIGERGVRLSGGQRQRIGIARALYRQPTLLILDEATSALDNLTEQAVMEAVHTLGHTITIILIAHRLSTVRECDRIFLLEKGHVLGSGTFEELVTSNEVFRGMVRATEESA